MSRLSEKVSRTEGDNDASTCITWKPIKQIIQFPVQEFLANCVINLLIASN